MKEVFVRFVLYGLTGWCVELVYTAIIDSYHKKDWNLTGKTYLWMFFVYGSAVFLFEPVHELILNFPIILRFIIWSLGITGIEFISGFLIKKVSVPVPGIILIAGLRLMNISAGTTFLSGRFSVLF